MTLNQLHTNNTFKKINNISRELKYVMIVQNVVGQSTPGQMFAARW